MAVRPQRQAKKDEAFHERLPPKSAEASRVSIAIEGIRDAIAHGRLVPGQRLLEAEMCEQFQVSRNTMREALRMLATEGIVAAEHNRGFSVRRFSATDLVLMMRAHEALAGLNTRMAAERVAVQRTSTKELLAIVERMGKATRAGDVEAFLEQYPPFHNLVAEMGGNTYVVALQRHLPIYVFRMYFRRMIDEEVIRAWYQEHRRIADAIRTGDGDGAEAAVREHYVVFRERSEALFASAPQGSVAWPSATSALA